MNREKNIYKKGDYVAFLSNKPIAHLNDMFGYNDLTEDDFEKTEHIGFIKSVIGNGEAFLLFTIRPIEGFRCTAKKEDILRAVDISELTEQERNRREREVFAPPTVYINTEVLEGSIEEKCKYLVRKAMAANYPEVSVESISMMNSEYLKEDLLKKVDAFLQRFCNIARQDLIDKMKAKRERFANMLKDLYFIEYYQVMLGWYEDEEHTTICYDWAVVDTSFEEIYILFYEDRARFYHSLGPDYDLVFDNMQAFLHELTW